MANVNGGMSVSVKGDEEYGKNQRSDQELKTLAMKYGASEIHLGNGTSVAYGREDLGTTCVVYPGTVLAPACVEVRENLKAAFLKT